MLGIFPQEEGAQVLLSVTAVVGELVEEKESLGRQRTEAFL